MFISYINRLLPYLTVAIGLTLLFLSDKFLAGYTYGVRTQSVRITDISQVLPVSEPYVRPMLYTNLSGLSTLPTDDAKKTFISAVLPAVLVAKHELSMIRMQLIRLEGKRSWNHKDSVVFRNACERFKTTDLKELLQKVGTLPTSVVLAQAAVESGWGQSRFFLEGNNLFGIWSFNPAEPRIAAGEMRGKRTIWLRSYNNMSESIISYFEMLSTSGAFKGLRAARHHTSDPFALVPYLRNFSERRGGYTRQLKMMIQQNDLTRYDQMELDPDYLFER
ncbi:glucosaminidase domain-containing protein [Chryseolinea sp. T2]|uniref:glucosaminidase domain-containing protein n=1 Tax=Chryseolinea sp. T2 TaxID=3129255 RepID=UPI00307740FB